MNGPLHSWWMYNRLLPDRYGYMQEFPNGVNQFDAFARKQVKFQGGGEVQMSICKV